MVAQPPGEDALTQRFDSRALAPLGELAIDVRRDLADKAIGAALHILDESDHAVTFYNQLSFMRKLLVLTLYMFG